MPLNSSSLIQIHFFKTVYINTKNFPEHSQFVYLCSFLLNSVLKVWLNMHNALSSTSSRKKEGKKVHLCHYFQREFIAALAELQEMLLIYHLL